MPFADRKERHGNRIEKLEKQAWFLWLTKYWFLFPIAGFLLLEGGVFLYFGEKSYIAVHDNMDLFLAQFQMLKNTGSFWAHGVDVPFLGASAEITCLLSCLFIVCSI